MIGCFREDILICTNFVWTNFFWTNVNMIVGICSRCSQEPIFKVSSKSGQLELRYSWYGQMSWRQMLPGQMSSWQLESVLNVHRNLPLKFHQNRVSNSWYIADIEFVWVGVGWCAKSFSCLTQLKVMLGWVELWLSWGFDNIGFNIGFNIRIQYWVQYWVQYLF